MAITSDTYSGDVSEFLSGAYFKKTDFTDTDEQRALVIAGVERVDFKGQDGPETKLQLTFTDETKKLTLNQTNLKILVKRYGKKSSDWIGKSVVLYLDENVMFGSNAVGGLRLRVPKTGRPAPEPDDDGVPF